MYLDTMRVRSIKEEKLSQSTIDCSWALLDVQRQCDNIGGWFGVFTATFDINGWISATILSFKILKHISTSSRWGFGMTYHLYKPHMLLDTEKNRQMLTGLS